jgi:hypothetical protein
MRVKLFSQHHPCGNELNLGGMEDAINAWLAQNSRVRIVDVKQSATGGSLAPSLWLLSVWYEDPASPAECVEHALQDPRATPDSSAP